MALLGKTAPQATVLEQLQATHTQATEEAALLIGEIAILTAQLADANVKAEQTARIVKALGGILVEEI